jgi:lipopolysaccharide transport system permease protein
VIELWRFRDLLLTLGVRDLKLRYKQTALGIIWVVLQPLIAAGVFSFVFGKIAGLKAPNGMPYFLFCYAGQVAWSLFSSTLTKSSGCLIGNAQLISKVFFPRLILPLSTVPSVLVDFFVAAAMLAVMLLCYHVPVTWRMMILPVWIAMLLLMSLGVGLLASALTVTYRDVQYILPVALQILLYASPVGYPMQSVPARLRIWCILNPLTTPLEGFRWSILGSGQLQWQLILCSVFLAVGVFVIGLFTFKRMERRFADVI